MLVTTLLLAVGLPSAALAAEPGLRGQWHLDTVTGAGASSTTPDSSGAGQTGTFTGTPSLVPGRFGQALDSAAANSWMNVAKPPASPWSLEPSDQVSVTAWIKTPSFPGALRYILAKGNFGTPGSCNGSSYALYTGFGSGGDLGLSFYVWTDTSSAVRSPIVPAASPIWTDGKWHAITGTYDGATVRLYVDGAQFGAGTPATGSLRYAGSAADAFTVGRYADQTCTGNSQFTGAIDEVRVHDHALTPAQITKLHDTAAAAPPDLGEPGTTVPPPTTTTTTTPPPAPPRPPFVIAELPARNIAPPALQSTRQGSDSAVYSCTNGEWEGLGDDPQFTRWIYSRDLNTGKDSFVTGTSGYVLKATSTKRLLFCVVRARTRSGTTIAATGATRLVPDFRISSSVFGPLVSSKTDYTGDLRIRGIDVFQLVQPSSGAGNYGFEGFPVRDRAFPTTCGGGTPTTLALPGCKADGKATQQATYNGVPVDADKPTSAVVYLDRVPGGPSVRSDAQLQVRLQATAGARLRASLTRTVRAFDLRSSTSDAVTTDERGDERFGVRFDLPQSWLLAAANGTFDLTASVSIVGAPETRQCQTTTIIARLDLTAGCYVNDTFTLSGTFARVLTFSAIIRAIALTAPSQTLASLKSPASVLAGAQDVLPGGEHFQISPYAAQVGIDPATATNAKNCPAPAGEAPSAVAPRLRTCASANVTNAVRAWVAGGPARTVEASPTDGFHVLVAVHNYQYTAGATEPGSSFNGGGVGKWGRSNNQPYLQINDGTINRPLTAATHELVHAMGAPHAGVKLAGIGGDPSCGGDNNGQVGEPWPNDQAGRLQGVASYPSSADRPRTADSDTPVPNASTPLWDFMSYCTGDATAWISPRNWNRTFAFMIDAEDVVPTSFQVPVRLRADTGQAPASGLVPVVTGAGFVVGIVDGAGARITGTEPADPEHQVPAGDDGSALRVRGLAADGRILGEVGARVTTGTDDGATTFIAPVPKGSAAVELVSGDAVVDRRTGGRPPTVRLISPQRRGTRVGRSLPVRYRASDPDGGALTAQVEFSPDGKSAWRTIARGPATGKATLPAQLLRTATAGRIRVKVSDGFATDEATSVALHVDGRPPTATIVRPARGERGQAAAAVVLLGQGADERGKRLRSRALTWFAGAKRLGTGERLRVRLAPGRVELRLVVRDARGRRTTARRTVRIDPVTLEIRTLRAAAVRAGARRFTVTVRTNVPAVLRGGGVTARVGPTTRRVRLALPAKPRTGIARVRLRLAPVGGGPALRPTVVVLRG